MTPISTFLAERLCDLEDEALIAVAVIANVDPGIARRAAAEQPIKASDALALLAAVGRDPVTRAIMPPRRVGKFDHLALALGVILKMQTKSQSIRAAAKAMDVSPRAITRLLDGDVVSIVTVIKACAYLGIHPLDQCEPVREAA